MLNPDRRYISWFDDEDTERIYDSKRGETLVKKRPGKERHPKRKESTTSVLSPSLEQK